MAYYLLNRIEPKWIEESNLDDDRFNEIKDKNEIAKLIEGKTFGLNSITNAFKENYIETNKTIFNINFKIID